MTFFCFTLPYALFPVGMMWAVNKFEHSPFTLRAMAVDGGILAVAIGLNAAAVKRLVANDSKWPELKIPLAGFASMTMMCAGSFYGLRYVRGIINSADFANMCVVLLIVTIVISTFCMFFPEETP